MFSMLAATEMNPGQNPAGVANADGDDVFVLPSTVGQQGFWYLDQLQPGNTAYNIAVRFRLQGPLRFDCLERALNAIVARHESLRTYSPSRWIPMQVIAPKLTIPLPQMIPGEMTRTPPADELASEEASAVDLARPAGSCRLQRLSATCC